MRSRADCARQLGARGVAEAAGGADACGLSTGDRGARSRCRSSRATPSRAIAIADGTVGTKNILAISTTVQCVAATVDYAVKRIKAELLPRYPNVDDVVAIDTSLRLRRGHRCARRVGSHPHAAQPEPQSELWWRDAGGEPGLRKTAALAA